MAYRCANDAVWSMEEVSEGASELTGYAPEQLVGNRDVAYGELVHPDDRDALREEVQRAIAERRRFRLTYRIRDRSGAERWVREQGSAVVDVEGNVDALEGYIEDVTDLKEGESHFESLFRDNRIPMVLIDPSDGALLDANRAACAFYGWPCEALTGRRFHDLCRGEKRDPDTAIEQSLSDQRHTFSLEHGLADGSTRSVEVVLGPLRWHGRRVLYGIVQDVTARRRAESELRRSEEFMRAFIAASPVALFSLTPDRRVLTWNVSAERIFGWAADEVIGRPLPIVPADTHDEFVRICDEISSGEEVHRHGLARRRKDGSLIECNLSAAPIYGEEGEVVALIAAIEDVTARNETMRRLAESEDRFKHVFEAANVAKSITSLDGVIDPNEAFARFVGLSRDEVRGKTWQDLTPADAIPSVEARIAPVVSGEIDETRFTKPYLHASGSTVWGDVSVTVRRDDRGRPLHYITTIVDITERMRAQAESERLATQLQQAQRLESVGRLAGGVAHDFNNILSVVLGYAEILLDVTEESHPQREAMAAILDGALRARDLTRQLLAFSRKQVLDFRTLDLDEIVRGVERLLRRVLGEDLELVLSLTDEPLLVRADARQIEQVLMNLAINARDAMSDAGTLTIETSLITVDGASASERPGVEAGEYARLAVSDNGSGMDAKTLDRIFEPFFTTKGLEKGTGLGLATSYGIVKQHGGHVRVESAPGEGATFEILLPRVDARTADANEGTAPAERVPDRPGAVRILVVEDDAAVRALTTKVLRQAGFRVIDSQSTSDAVRRAVATSEPIHLVLTDVVMPDMTGPAVYEAVRERHPEARVLYMSGYADEFLVSRGVVANSSRFLQKPFTMNALLESVSKAIDEKEPREE